MHVWPTETESQVVSPRPWRNPPGAAGAWQDAQLPLGAWRKPAGDLSYDKRDLQIH